MVVVSEMKVGTTAKVTAIKASSMIKKRLLAMGLTPGTEIRIVKVAPMGDPIELTVRGYRLSLRKSEASCLEADIVGND